MTTPGTAPLTTPAPGPAVDGRVIGLAHYASRAVLESVLARHGLTFQQLVTLRLVSVAGAPVERDGLTGQVTESLKVDPAEARRTVDALIARELVAPEASRLRITDAGQAVYAGASAETAPVSARIYAGIPAADLATAGRVLALVTERANAELAALSR
ncbi:MarR family transcriptional regulator [Streptomyces sp. ALI-76-A]|uniref:MarR family winged helix-turn-helix transcriptional regulator n=1 Tax=Streptomyces sp. ALI-76-A TaxID=3025736 RepID=UPI00256EF39B|nr:MarR family transcriptional regulator [Streptomyces sp. ALI-76-A]MDL5205235.1 MarR family transcriptional regulator [Streptomyces sp. ALI-76-A]